MDPAEILPPELMSRIFALAIGSYHDLHSILHVSRAWYQLARHNSIVWKTLARRWFPFFDWRRSHLIHESDWRPRAWNELYKFGDLESDQSSTTYRDALQQVLDGQRWCFAQVFDRSMFTNAGGTQLSAYDAVIRRIPNREIEQRPELRSTWAAYYMGASTAEPDSKCFFNHEVDIVHQRRLRAIPKQVRAVYDPFKAYFLEPLESLAVDMEIELQFRFSPTKPFGWWRGIISAIVTAPTDEYPFEAGDQAVIRVALPQYQAHQSPLPFWDHELITYCRPTMKAVTRGAWQRGGLRIPTAAEAREWLFLRQHVWQVRDRPNETLPPRQEIEAQVEYDEQVLYVAITKALEEEHPTLVPQLFSY